MQQCCTQWRQPTVQQGQAPSPRGDLSERPLAEEAERVRPELDEGENRRQVEVQANPREERKEGLSSKSQDQ